MQKNQFSQPVRHLTHRRLAAIFLSSHSHWCHGQPAHHGYATPNAGRRQSRAGHPAAGSPGLSRHGPQCLSRLRRPGVCLGDNVYGQTGAEGQDHVASPVQVELPEPAQAVSAGAYHTLILGQSGTVYALGRNAYGQVGDGGVTNVSSPVRVTGLPVIKAISAGAYHSLALGEDGSVWAWGHNTQGAGRDVPSDGSPWH